MEKQVGRDLRMSFGPYSRQDRDFLNISDSYSWIRSQLLVIRDVWISLHFIFSVPFLSLCFSLIKTPYSFSIMDPNSAAYISSVSD